MLFDTTRNERLWLALIALLLVLCLLTLLAHA